MRYEYDSCSKIFSASYVHFQTTQREKDCMRIFKRMTQAEQEKGFPEWWYINLEKQFIFKHKIKVYIYMCVCVYNMYNNIFSLTHQRCTSRI